MLTGVVLVLMLDYGLPVQSSTDEDSSELWVRGSGDCARTGYDLILIENGRRSERTGSQDDAWLDNIGYSHAGACSA